MRIADNYIGSGGVRCMIATIMHKWLSADIAEFHLCHNKCHNITALLQRPGS